MKKSKVLSLSFIFLTLFLTSFPLLAEGSGETVVNPLQGVTMFCIVLTLIFGATYYANRHLLEVIPSEEKKISYLPIILLLGGAFLIRLFCAIKFAGESTTMNNWAAWALHLADYSLPSFYVDLEITSYPPLYMLVLWFVGKIIRGLSLTFGTTLYSILLKSPLIIGDLMLGWIIYSYASKKQCKGAFFFTFLVLFNPAIITVSSIWGQTDTLIAIFVGMMIIALMENKLTNAFLNFAFGLLLSSRMLYALPVLVLGYIYYCKEKKANTLIKNTAIGLISSLSVFFIVCLPFIIKLPAHTWLNTLYTPVTTTYGSINALNLWALLGGMWQDPASATVLGISLRLLGTIGLIIAIVIPFILALRDDKKIHFPLYSALIFIGIFLFNINMNERDLIIGIVLLALAYLYTSYSYILLSFLGLSAISVLNISITLENQFITTLNPPLSLLISLAIIIYGGLIYYSIKLKRGEQIPELIVPQAPKQPTDYTHIVEKELAKLKDIRYRLTKKDIIICSTITLLYAFLAFYQLGELHAPTTMWETTTTGETTTIDLGTTSSISSLKLYMGLCTSDAKMTIELSNDNTTWSTGAEIAFNDENTDFNSGRDLYKYKTLTLSGEARYLRFTVENPTLRLIEISPLDQNGAPITIQAVTGTGISAFDEQGLMPTNPTYYNEFYFDEIYHARTAWEHLNGVTAYETSHPPLGKVLMMFGVWIFGMTPFGWRFSGALAGVIMIPFIYVFAKALFKNTKYATIAALLLAFDFMHYTQTRIATIDSYVVCFIIPMYYFMYLFYRNSYLLTDKKGFKKCLLYLALSGICFGLGSASKWTGIYAGAGLAILFFYCIFLRYKEYDIINKNKELALHITNRATLKETYTKRTLQIILWCCLFFVAVPITIYIASYLPQIIKLDYSLKDIWNNQLSMFSYHSKLTATHPFESPWYQWPFINRPIWYYVSTQGDQSISISALGNPAVWWAGAIAIIYALITTVKEGGNSTSKFIAVGFLAQLAPWMLVTRCTFIYHYFPSVPFIILALVWFIKRLEKNTVNQKYFNIVLGAYIALVIGLFILYYPAIGGLPASSNYLNGLELFKTWHFI